VTTLNNIGEDALIARLTSLLPRDANPAAGPGDDCAVVDPGPKHPTLQLLKTDAIVGQVHFLKDTPAHSVGWKAAARVISDFAAMGGHPDRFLITLALPAETEVEWVENLYRGIGDCLETFGAVLAGGETTRVPQGSSPVISLAATGSVRREHLVLRSTAKPGQTLLVTGTLGGSDSGKHLNFIPRIKQTDWMVSNYKPAAMMDISDGLAKDLPRLAAASGCGFILDRGAIPCSLGCSEEQALGDGEDYEMLIAMKSEQVADLLQAWGTAFPELPLTVIGRLVELGTGMSLSGGWDHFSRGLFP